MTPSVYVIAGEPSGDQLGGHLLAGLKAETGARDLRMRGIGGEMMAAEGLSSLFPMSDLSVMGLTEVLPRLPLLLRRVREAAEDVIAARPDVLITIDSPDFCLRVAKRVKRALPDLKTVHYVAPSVWAWRPGRADKMARVIDHVLALLPFEPPYMQAAGMSCDFVGHPVARLPVATVADAARFRDAHGIGVDTPLLCLLPGSRRGEIALQGPVFRDAVGLVQQAMPDLAVVIPAAGPVADDVAAVFAAQSPAPIILDPRGIDPDKAQESKFAAFAASDLALASSGTVSLELARQGTPMVIGYQMKPLSRWLMKRLVRLDTATLVNIVTETRAVPEYLFDDFRPAPIAAEIARLLTDSDSNAAQRRAGQDSMALLGAGDIDPGRRAAQSVLRFLAATS